MDIFGSTDPKLMPKHLFFGCLELRYHTAVRGNPERQNYSVCPRHWYIDAVFRCKKCKHSFTWTAKEQLTWFEKYFFWVDSRPHFCLCCRTDARHLAALRKEYDLTVALARDHGSIDQKHRIVVIVTELQNANIQLPKGLLETRDTFEKQIKKRAQPGAQPDAGTGRKLAP